MDAQTYCAPAPSMQAANAHLFTPPAKKPKPKAQAKSPLPPEAHCPSVTLLDEETFTLLDGWDEIQLRFRRNANGWYCDLTRDGVTTQTWLSEEGHYPRHHEKTTHGWFVWGALPLRTSSALKVQFEQSRGAGLILLSRAYGVI